MQTFSEGCCFRLKCFMGVPHQDYSGCLKILCSCLVHTRGCGFRRIIPVLALKVKP